MNSEPPAKYPITSALLRNTPRAQILARQLGVESLFVFSKFNNKASNGPYHNTLHACDVARLAYGLAAMVKHTVQSCRSVFIAGLFHDFNHSLGKSPDFENILEAQKGLLDALKVYGSELPSRQERYMALEAISATQYPYEQPKFHFTDICAILRDADRLQIVTLHWRSQIRGLGLEMNVSIEELVKRSKAFHIELLQTLESPPAQALKPELEFLIESRHDTLSRLLDAGIQA